MPAADLRFVEPHFRLVLSAATQRRLGRMMDMLQACCASSHGITGVGGFKDAHLVRAVLQDMKSGSLSVGDVPPPALQRGGILVQVTRSVISLGTERSIIALARKGPIGKAQDRPDLARKVLNRARQEGLWSTYQVVKNLLASPIPLGYSCAGRVIAVGSEVPEFRFGDRVACAVSDSRITRRWITSRNRAVRSRGVADDGAAFRRSPRSRCGVRRPNCR
jgi:hypothetical protein